jgi:hypothetical protein
MQMAEQGMTFMKVLQVPCFSAVDGNLNRASIRAGTQKLQAFFRMAFHVHENASIRAGTQKLQAFGWLSMSMKM